MVGWGADRVIAMVWRDNGSLKVHDRCPLEGLTGGGIEGGAGLRRRLWAHIMVLYHQLGPSLWPGLRRQPQPAPQSPTSQVQPQPAQAQPKHADPPAPFAVGE